MSRKKKKKLITVDDLYKFCLKNKMYSFNSNDDGSELFVQMPATFNKESNEDKYSENQSRFISRAFHDKINLNGSKINEKEFKDNLPSAHLRPILANIKNNSEGLKDFGSHDMFMDTDENGDPVLIYEERPVGVIDGTQTTIEFDEKANVNRAVLHGFIFDEYCSDVIEILDRRGTVSCSVELGIRELSFDVEDNVLVLEDFYVSGLTLLGSDINPGMAGSNFKIEDAKFSLFSDEERLRSIVAEVIEKYANTLMPLKHKKYSGKEEDSMPNTETFENEAAVVEEPTVEEDITETEETFEEEVIDSENPEEAFEEDSTEVEVVDSETDDVDTIEKCEEVIEFTATRNGETKTFSVSINDKLSAAFELINSTYSDTDGDIYDVTMYEAPERILEFHGWFSGKHYRQAYSVKKNVYSLIGDRCETFARYLSKEEIDSFESMKSKYSQMEETLTNYESEPEKLEVLNSDEYSVLNGNEEFESLKEQSNHFDLTVEDLKSKCDSILLDVAKKNPSQFALINNSEDVKVDRKHFTAVKKNKNYGSLFNGIV